MLTIAALFLLAPPANFTVVNDTVKIEKAVWFDGEGQKHVTDQPYLQIRMTVTNNADHPVRWPGFHRARVKYGTRYVGGALLPVASFGPGCRWENSLVTDSVVNPGQRTTILVVFDVPKIRNPASLELQWKGETPGWNMTIKKSIKLPEDK